MLPIIHKDIMLSRGNGILILDDKPKLLEKMYLTYVDEKITWEELMMYSEILDNFIQRLERYFSKFGDLLFMEKLEER